MPVSDPDIARHDARLVGRDVAVDQGFSRFVGCSTTSHSECFEITLVERYRSIY